MSTLTERYADAYAELQKVTAALNRIDERVEIFITKQTELERRVELHIEGCPVRSQFPKLYTQVAVIEETCAYAKEKFKSISEKQQELELKLQKVDMLSEQNKGTWKGLKGFFLIILVNLIWVVAAAFILSKIGLPTILP